MKKYDELFLTTTDTVTGLGGPVNKKNFEAIYALKGRPKSKPLVIMVPSIEEARKLQGWNKVAEEYANKHWPGALTLVLTDTISVRMPDNSGLLNLLSQKGPCYMTSANISGEDTYSIKKAKDVFQEIKESYDFGPSSGKPSKIVDVRTGKVLR